MKERTNQEVTTRRMRVLLGTYKDASLARIRRSARRRLQSVARWWAGHHVIATFPQLGRCVAGVVRSVMRDADADIFGTPCARKPYLSVSNATRRTIDP
jgi:hypothetical protein